MSAVLSVTTAMLTSSLPRFDTVVYEMLETTVHHLAKAYETGYLRTQISGK